MKLLLFFFAAVQEVQPWVRPIGEKWADVAKMVNKNPVMANGKQLAAESARQTYGRLKFEHASSAQCRHDQKDERRATDTEQLIEAVLAREKAALTTAADASAAPIISKRKRSSAGKLLQENASRQLGQLSCAGPELDHNASPSSGRVQSVQDDQESLHSDKDCSILEPKLGELEAIIETEQMIFVKSKHRLAINVCETCDGAEAPSSRRMLLP